MTKGVTIIFTFILLASSLVVINQYETASMSSTATGVNTSGTPYNESYQASTQTTIAAISVSHYTTLIIAVSTVLITVVVVAAMVLIRRRKKV